MNLSFNCKLVRIEEKIYAEAYNYAFCAPQKTTMWYRLEGSYRDLVSFYGSCEEANKHIGEPLAFNGYGYENEAGTRYNAVGGPAAYPEMNVTEDVPEPKVRGKNVQLRWRDGSWEKWTPSKGKWTIVAVA